MESAVEAEQGIFFDFVITRSNNLTCQCKCCFAARNLHTASVEREQGNGSKDPCMGKGWDHVFGPILHLSIKSISGPTLTLNPSTLPLAPPTQTLDL